jgi:hypothetical protein
MSIAGCLPRRSSIATPATTNAMASVAAAGLSQRTSKARFHQDCRGSVATASFVAPVVDRAFNLAVMAFTAGFSSSAISFEVNDRNM